MNMSDTISELATALAKAQGQIESASKEKANGAFSNSPKYADINALRDVIRKPLADNDLSIVQLARMNGTYAEVETMLLHKSGEFIAETLRMPSEKMTSHGVGSALTYCRRYSLSAMLNLAAEDDDGNAAANLSSQPARSYVAPKVRNTFNDDL